MVETVSISVPTCSSSPSARRGCRLGNGDELLRHEVTQGHRLGSVWKIGVCRERGRVLYDHDGHTSRLGVNRERATGLEPGGLLYTVIDKLGAPSTATLGLSFGLLRDFHAPALVGAEE